jgi:Protein of unknown function (DUF2442)
MEKLPRVKTVKVLEKRRVLLGFTDGVQREIDLGPYLRGPIFKTILEDDKLFQSVKVDQQLGTIVWESGADMDPDVLYGSNLPVWMTEKEASRK